MLGNHPRETNISVHVFDKKTTECGERSQIFLAASSKEPTVSPPCLIVCGCQTLRKISLHLPAGVAAANQIKREISEQIPKRAAGGSGETGSVSICE